MRSCLFVAIILVAACDGSSGPVIDVPTPPVIGEIAPRGPREWSAPVAAASALSAQNLVLAVDSRGVVTAVWDQDHGDGTGWDIVTSRRTPNGSWDPVEIIIETGLDPNDSSDAPRMKLVATQDGDLILVWDQSNGVWKNVWETRRVAGVWEKPGLIEHDDTGDATDPQLVIDDSDRATIVWSQSVNGQRGIWSCTSNPTTECGAVHLISRDDPVTGDATRPALAVGKDGDVIVVWHQGTRDRTDIWSNRFEQGIGWWDAYQIEHDDAGSAADVSVIANPDGTFIAVWPQSDGMIWNAWSSVWTPVHLHGQLWGIPTMIEAKIGNVQRMSITTDADGVVTALWNQSDGPGTQYRGWANRRSAGLWGEPEKIGEMAGQRIDAVADTFGSVLAVWASPGLMNQYLPGAGWAAAGPIGDGMRSIWEPHVVADLTGRVTVVWLHRENFVTTVWAKVLE
jgi:hypothetical protein